MNYRTLEELIREIKNSLSGLYPDHEIGQFSNMIVEHLLNYSKIDIQLKRNEFIAEHFFQQALEIIDQLKEFRPIQYIFGKAHFYGFELMVDERVLIPRQETEELVQWIVDDYSGIPVKIMDVGTGSGCIAITLAKVLPKSNLHALDISSGALELAGENATFNSADVAFFEADIFDPDYKQFAPEYNVVVSNPPYVRESEKGAMGRNVTGYEPQIALFVEDSFPLLFYHAVARFGRQVLSKNGILYCEINEAYGHEVQNLLNVYGYYDIELRKDINGKDRMVKAICKCRE